LPVITDEEADEVSDAKDEAEEAEPEAAAAEAERLQTDQRLRMNPCRRLQYSRSEGGGIRKDDTVGRRDGDLITDSTVGTGKGGCNTCEEDGTEEGCDVNHCERKKNCESRKRLCWIGKLDGRKVTTTWTLLGKYRVWLVYQRRR
jgi:hypothetical protein